ncbi:hypothetical protein Dda_6302 [Drechslerella dactyloides]|uniref:C2H2-type domain-containing protein n=1 Tax=Drechslerella dactyloides TaxID=74499 RepID=A0AAD6IVW3_DREDA|nr:hypothetical protein Dda_6302 [Drechslerella dactyloides]
MGSNKYSHSDVPTEQSTSYFNASYFPESNSYFADELSNNSYEHFGQFDFTTPASYDSLRKETAEKSSLDTQTLVLGNATSQYQPYYPTNEEVPITAGLGTDLINWKLCSRNSSSYTGTRSQTSGQRTSRSKNGQTPPTVCETATIVNGGIAEFNEDIDLDMAASKENFDHLTRFNKQKSIMKHVDNTVSQQSAVSDIDQSQYPSLASTKEFFPTWEIEAYHNNHIDAIDDMGLHFEVDADSTVSKSQTQSSVFTGGNRRTAPSVTSYTESSVADSAISERFNPQISQIMPTNYTRFLEEDAFSYSPDYMVATEYTKLPMVPPNLQYALDTALEKFEASLKSQQQPSKAPQSPPAKRRPKKDHVCTTCNAVFTEKTNLTRHIKSRKCTTGGPDMFLCPATGCTRSYEGRSDNLKAHMKRVHRKEWSKLRQYPGDWRDKRSLEQWLYVNL